MDTGVLSVRTKKRQPQNIEVLATDTLNSILQHFFAEINEKDGKDYEPSSFFFGSNTKLNYRYLCELNYEYSILTFQKI